MNWSDQRFSAEELAKLEPWRLPRVDGEESAEAPQEKLPMLTVDEIEAVQQQAYQEAYQKGLAEGRDTGLEQGLEQGRNQGLAEGHEQSRQLLAAKTAELEQLINALTQPLAAVDAEVEQELIALAVAMAKQLLRRELKQDPGQIIAAVREAMAVLPANARRIQLILHPEDADLVREVLNVEALSPAWRLIEDPLISRGGCKVDTESSFIDASVEKRMAEVIAQVLGDERGHAASASDKAHPEQERK